MEPLAWLAIIPAGVLGWHLTGIVRGQLGRKRALRELPQVVEGLGVVGQNGAAPGRFATYDLEYKGRSIMIAPETAGYVMAHTSAEVPWWLSTMKLPIRKHGMEYFETGDPAFDSTFKSRCAAPEVADKLRNDAAARQQILDAASSDKLGAKWVQLDGNAVSMSAKESHGMGAPNYIRADGLAERLDAIDQLASRVDACFAAQYPRDS